MRRLAALLVMLAGVLPASLAAQEVSLGIRGGVTFPNGAYGDSASSLKTGWNVGAVGRVEFGTSRFGLQADLGYSANAIEGYPGGLASDWQGGLALMFNILAPSSPLRPYLLLGLGVDYWQDDSGNGITPAFYGGGGIDARLDPIMPYIELQYRNVMTPGDDLKTIQLIFGLRYLVGYR